MTTVLPLPCIKIHAATSPAAGKHVVVGKHKAELLHGENLLPNVMVQIALCDCCGPLSDQDAKQIFDVALEKLAPMHSMRLNAVADGYEIVTENEACSLLKIGRTKFWELVNSGTFPKPMKRGKNNVWLIAELRARYARYELK